MNDLGGHDAAGQEDEKATWSRFATSAAETIAAIGRTLGDAAARPDD